MLSLQYPTLIRENKEHYFAICETLGLIAEGSDVTSAYEALNALRRQILERFDRLYITAPTPKSSLSKYLKSSQNSISASRKFALGLGISLIFLVLLAAPLLFAVSAAKKAMNRVNTLYTKVTTPANLSETLANVATILKDITPQRKLELHQNLQAIMQELTPFWDDIHDPLIGAEDEGTMSSPQIPQNEN